MLGFYKYEEGTRIVAQRVKPAAVLPASHGNWFVSLLLYLGSSAIGLGKAVEYGLSVWAPVTYGGDPLKLQAAGFVLALPVPGHWDH